MPRLLVLVVLLVPCFAFAATPTSAEQILAQSKAASGGDLWNGINTIQIKGKVLTGGLSGAADQMVDVHGGRLVRHYAIGPYQGAQGYDGKMGWKQAPSGEVSPDDTPAAQKADVTNAYIAARGYWFPERWAAQIELLGARREDENHFEVLRITPQGGDSFELWINAETYLVDRTVMTTPTGTETRTFNEYLSVNGVQIPFHQWIFDGSQYTILRFDSASVNVPESDKDFSQPQQNLNDYAFIGGGSQATIPFQLINNRIYLRASVLNRPLQFQLSTSGVNLLTVQAARKAGIQSVGNFKGKGPGGSSASATRVNTLTLGGEVALSNQLFRVAKAPGFTDAEGSQFDGLVGFEIFKRFVVQINYAFRKVTLILPANFNPQNAGTPIPFTLINGQIPQVAGSIDGVAGQFEIDTGSSTGLSLSSSFAKAHDLDSRFHLTPEVTVDWGLGGKLTGRVGRASALKLDGIVVRNPVLDVGAASQDAAGVSGISGVIGGDVLRRFTVTFDYTNQRMYLNPNKNFNTPMDYDRAGLWINQYGKTFVVASVFPGGPADEAGIKPGDVITGVNDKVAGDLSLSDVRASLRDGEPGSKVRLAVVKGKTSHWVTLVLRRLIPATGG
ncbi:MAG: PDZ domain-containing protein [Gammaproteobacteria bacterium]